MGFRDWLSGHERKIPKPDFFDAGTVGGEWGDYLKKLYATDTGDTEIFRSQSSALRDALSRETDAQKDEFGGAVNAGGFYDSGARLTGLNDINRSKMFSYSQGLSAILAKLESDKMSAAFPFLQAQTGVFSAWQDALQGTENAQTSRKIQIGQSASSVGSAFAGGGGSGTTQKVSTEEHGD